MMRNPIPKLFTTVHTVQRRCDLNWLIEEMEGRRSEEVEKAEAEREGDRGGGERDSRQRELLSFNQ